MASARQLATEPLTFIEELARRTEAKRRGLAMSGQWGGSVQAHEEYQTRPIDWIVEKLGVPENTLRWSMNEGYERCGCAECERRGNTGPHVWDGDVDPIATMFETIAAGKDCGVESATGTGKSYGAALMVFWFLACFKDAIVVTAAPKEDQLLLHIWKEIGALWPRFQAHFPQAELLNGKIRMRAAEEGKEKWAATAFVCGVGANEESATKAQGFHAEHMLIITEETPGIHPAIMTAFFNTRTDDHNLHLALGNPDNQHDPLHQFCMEPGVVHLRVSALDHPNIVCGRTVVPGALGPKRLAQRTERYGKGSPLYLSRVRGISPSEAANALIKWEWCVAAAERGKDRRVREEMMQGLPALGVDVANSENGDNGAISRWQGAVCTEVEDFPCPNASDLGIRVAREAKNPQNPVDPRHIGVDNVGVGASTVNKLREEGLRVRQIGGAVKAVPGLDIDTLWSTISEDFEGTPRPMGPAVLQAEQFNNLRSQVWWQLREDLRLGRIILPEDEDLWRDLTTPTFTTRNGVIVVESKEDIAKRLKRSPNKGDACAYGNFVRRRVPLRPKERVKLESDRNTDRGLDRLLYERMRREEKERRVVDRRLKRIARRRRSPV